jgi:transposase-like protein
MFPLHPKTAQKMSLKSERSIRSETEISRITIGPTWRSTARKVKRLKESCSIIEPEYSAQTYTIPDFMALSMKLRSSKYLNNLIEQDHRGIKSRTRPMLGFKSFASAANAIAGVELLRRIHKRQFGLSRLRRRGQAGPAIWNAVRAA